MSQVFPHVGLHCTGIGRATYAGPDGVESLGALQIDWSDGTASLFDVSTDWALTVSGREWSDPLLGVADRYPDEGFGRWSIASVARPDPLGAVVGTALKEVRTSYNAMHELQSVELDFGTSVLGARSWGGELQIEIA
jgi:hypothetical protein